MNCKLNVLDRIADVREFTAIALTLSRLDFSAPLYRLRPQLLTPFKNYLSLHLNFNLYPSTIIDGHVGFFFKGLNLKKAKYWIRNSKEIK